MKWAAVVGGVALACAASMSSRAADLGPLGPAYKAPGYIPAYFNWTGYYAGLAIGDGFGPATMLDPFAFNNTPGGVPVSMNLNGFLLGGYTGVNYQVGSIVFGFEGDFTGSWAKGSAIDTVAVVPGNALSVDVLWTATATARVGWAFDRLLLYVKGGGGFAFHRDTITLAPASPAAGAPIGSAGTASWTIGTGVDWAVTEHWIARAEYDYINLPVKAFVVSAPFAATQVSAKMNEVKVGMAYKF